MDITMCDNVNCPIKNSCHRFTGPRDKYGQSIFVGNPCEWYDDWFYCEHFWDNFKKRLNDKKGSHISSIL